MIYIVKINNKEYEVEVEKGRAAIVKTTEIDTPGAPLPAVSAPVAAAAPAATPAAAVAPSGANVITAPMPGTILDIKTAPGKQVKKGEVLLILEAMKMENEVVAPADGVVAQVSAVKGSSVATGDVLISLQ